ncbi:inactive protein RESTRICTED TEV MOVEMENT 2-like [Curcuma longa]|uniref:inactive protein RESTRICTED TEV MOVEMENT 2-like n=1 Tax=Curcuma longa TaxID=136217 RepID=UPI003D9F1192
MHSNINNLLEFAKVTEMEAKSSLRTFTQCFPPCEWIKWGELDALLVDVSGLGFEKEDLKVQADTSGKLSVSGERAVEGNRWLRFLKTFQLPKECNVREIQANLDKETLYVLLPKPADKMVKGRGGGGVLRDPRKRKTLIISTVVVTVLAAGLGTYVASKLL